MSKMMIIDMSKFNSVEVDAQAEPPTVKIGGGALNADVDKACAPHGIAVTQGCHIKYVSSFCMCPDIITRSVRQRAA
jgi:hypothetical protein